MAWTDFRAHSTHVDLGPILHITQKWSEIIKTYVQQLHYQGETDENSSFENKIAKDAIKQLHRFQDISDGLKGSRQMGMPPG